MCACDDMTSISKKANSRHLTTARGSTPWHSGLYSRHTIHHWTQYILSRPLRLSSFCALYGKKLIKHTTMADNNNNLPPSLRPFENLVCEGEGSQEWLEELVNCGEVIVFVYHPWRTHKEELFRGLKNAIDDGLYTKSCNIGWEDSNRYRAQRSPIFTTGFGTLYNDLFDKLRNAGDKYIKQFVNDMCKLHAIEIDGVEIDGEKKRKLKAAWMAYYRCEDEIEEDEGGYAMDEGEMDDHQDHLAAAICRIIGNIGDGRGDGYKRMSLSKKDENGNDIFRVTFDVRHGHVVYLGQNGSGYASDVFHGVTGSEGVHTVNLEFQYKMVWMPMCGGHALHIKLKWILMTMMQWMI